MEKWEGRVALVTGASSGIGYAIAKKLVQSGMKVVGAARNIKKIQELAQELSGEKGTLTAIKCNLGKEKDIINLFEIIETDFGGADICINNAGVCLTNNLLHGLYEQWTEEMNVNVIALCLCNKLTVKSMLARGVDDGHILCISSLCAYRVTNMFAGQTHFYSATKYATRALIEGYRQELREIKSHIRITGISPGTVETEIHERGLGAKFAENLYSSMKCLLPEDIANAVVHAITVPSHIEINDMILRPTDQEF